MVRGFVFWGKVMVATVAVGGKEIVNLAPLINEAHTRLKASVKTAMEEALSMGRRLAEARDRLGRGQWGDWVKKNLPFSIRQAQKYIKLGRNEDHPAVREVLDANSNSLFCLEAVLR